jgi:hypothetical protein
LSEGANCPAPLMIRKLALPMQRASLSDSPPIANGSYSPVSRYTSTGQLGDPGQGVAEGSVADEELRQGSDAFADSVFGVGHALPAWRGAIAADLVCLVWRIGRTWSVGERALRCWRPNAATVGR